MKTSTLDTIATVILGTATVNAGANALELFDVYYKGIMAFCTVVGLISGIWLKIKSLKLRAKELDWEKTKNKSDNPE